jgi:epoxyqueuosine reductase
MGHGRTLTATGVGTGLEELIKAQAYGVGFDLVGITTLGPADTTNAFETWIARGYAGDMDYLPRGADKRRDTRLPFPGARSAIVVGLNYGGTSASGPVARYARGDDYHEVMWRMLDTLHEWIDDQIGHATAGKSYVDTGPILERDLARRAGLGWFGKNTNLINPDIGSFFFIGSLLIDLELEPDTPFEADRCGTCTRCIDACPTSAIVEPRLLDATRCISYLTIEAKGAIPLERREEIGDRVYGCDICQDVCPWNVSFARDATNAAFAPRSALLGRARDVSRKILEMSVDEFRSTLMGSPIKRAKLRGLKRNAAVVLGNTGDDDDVPALKSSLDDADDLVREHASWAIGRIDARRSR